MLVTSYMAQAVTYNNPQRTLSNDINNSQGGIGKLARGGGESSTSWRGERRGKQLSDFVNVNHELNAEPSNTRGNTRGTNTLGNTRGTNTRGNVNNNNGYTTNWQVKHQAKNNYYGQEETLSDGEVKGEYYVLHPNGRLMRVAYSVTSNSGFRTRITYENNYTPQW